MRAESQPSSQQAYQHRGSLRQHDACQQWCIFHISFDLSAWCVGDVIVVCRWQIGEISLAHVVVLSSVMAQSASSQGPQRAAPISGRRQPRRPPGSLPWYVSHAQTNWKLQCDLRFCSDTDCESQKALSKNITRTHPNQAIFCEIGTNSLFLLLNYMFFPAFLAGLEPRYWSKQAVEMSPSVSAIPDVHVLPWNAGMSATHALLMYSIMLLNFCFWRFVNKVEDGMTHMDVCKHKHLTWRFIEVRCSLGLE